MHTAHLKAHTVYLFYLFIFAVFVMEEMSTKLNNTNYNLQKREKLEFQWILVAWVVLVPMLYHSIVLVMV